MTSERRYSCSGRETGWPVRARDISRDPEIPTVRSPNGGTPVGSAVLSRPQILRHAPTWFDVNSPLASR